MQLNRTARRLLKVGLVLLIAALSLYAVELGLRALKSLRFDGVMHLSSPSVNNVYHAKYGWLSPPNQTHEKTDACYGDGTISYNADGFRAPPPSEIDQADLFICILGDSTMQGFQIPDGNHLPHMLAAALKAHGYERPYVLPLAVGGYGQAQEWMLYKDYCRGHRPAVVIQHFDKNDIGNNSFLAARYAGGPYNNIRRRPFYEDDTFVMRRPYPFTLGPWLDGWLVFKLVNMALLKSSRHTDAQLETYLETGWGVTEALAKKLAAEPEGRPIALIDERYPRAIELYRSAGFEMAIYASFTKDEACPPRDSHPTPKGHQKMLDALMPVLLKMLKTSAK